MLSPCKVSNNRWVVIELCEEIGIDTIAIGNYEFFSSLPKHFIVYGSNRYCHQNDNVGANSNFNGNSNSNQEESSGDGSKSSGNECWVELGRFTAKKLRQLQVFHLQAPAWYK